MEIIFERVKINKAEEEKNKNNENSKESCLCFKILVKMDKPLFLDLSPANLLGEREGGEGA